MLDEMIGPRVANGLRERGLDVSGVVERTDLRALADDAVLEAAVEEGRVLVTRNVADFARLHQRWLAEDRTHAGLVLVSAQAFPQSRGFVGALVRALAGAAAESTLPGPGKVRWLQPASS